jgi:hypothetical protein
VGFTAGSRQVPGRNPVTRDNNDNNNNNNNNSNNKFLALSLQIDPALFQASTMK